MNELGPLLNSLLCRLPQPCFCKNASRQHMRSYVMSNTQKSYKRLALEFRFKSLIF